MSSHWGQRSVCWCVQCSWKFGSFGSLRFNLQQWLGHWLSSSWHWLWYSVLKYLLPSRSDLLNSSATSFSRPIWLSSSAIRTSRLNPAEPSAAMLSKPLSDFCWEVSLTSRTRNRVARLSGSNCSYSQNWRCCLIIVVLVTFRITLGPGVIVSPFLSLSFLVPNATSMVKFRRG